MAVVMSETEEDWKTAKEAAELVGLTPSWLIRNAALIAHKKIGPMWLFEVGSVKKWADERKRRGGSKPRKPKAEGEA